MIMICPDCSNVDMENIKELGEEVEEGCIGLCGSEFVCFVDEEMVEAHSEEELIEKLREIINS